MSEEVGGGSTQSRPGEPFALSLGEEAGAVRHARRWVGERLRDANLAQLTGDAQVLVSELVTNALLHAGPPAEVLLRVAAPTVRLEVRDRSPVPPVPSPKGTQTMTGRGLQVVEGLAHSWGVEPAPGGKAVWAEMQGGASESGPNLDEEELLSIWGDEEEEPPARGDAVDRQPAPSGDELFTVRLGRVPTDLLLAAKTYVDNLVREFTLAASGARMGTTAAVPEELAELIETVVNRFAGPRQAIKSQALEAARRGQEHTNLELALPVTAVEAAEDYLRALDEADAYCRAARLLTLESPAQHRIFRHWYIGELVTQLEQAWAGRSPTPGQSFEERLRVELDAMASANREAEQASRLHALAAALAHADTPEAVSQAVLTEGVAVLGSSRAGLLLAADSKALDVGGAVGYDESSLSQLRSEPPDAELPAATALRTGKPVWLETREERDTRFPEFAALEPDTVALCAVPLQVGERRLGALRFSFPQARLFDDAEREFVLAMAALTAQALDRALLYREWLDTARRLQRSLLPLRTPELPGVRITSAHQPFGFGMDVGGAFYDMWQVNRDRWAMAVGDAYGAGPEAAAVTALARHTLRALTRTGSGIVPALGHLNRAVMEAAEDGRSSRCTAVVGLIDRAPTELVFELGNGGHPGPLVFRADGTVKELELRGSPLGVLSRMFVAQRTVRLQPGDELVFFTDGVTETRDSEGVPFGTCGLVEAVHEARRNGLPTAQAVEQAVLRHGHTQVDDDLAVLTLALDDDDPAPMPPDEEAASGTPADT